jgi:hypothetical protein
MKKRMLVLGFTLYAIFTSLSVSAHVKWFTEEEPIKAPLEQIISPFFIIMAICIALFLGLMTQLAPKLMKLKLAQRLDHKLANLKPYTPVILRVGVALALLIQIAFNSILAPEIILTDLTMWIGLISAALLMIPHSYSLKLGAVGLLLLVAYGIGNVGWFHMLDYGFYLAIGFALLVQKTRYHMLSTPALYLGTGLSLCWVAIEKWVYPGMSVNIINNHQVPIFGLDPLIFIVISAFIEFVVGYLLVVGILNRLLALVLTGIFIMTTTLFGSLEIAGHFIVHVILLLFIIEGTGFYKPPIEMHQRRIDQVIFVVLNFLFVLSTILLIYYRFA